MTALDAHHQSAATVRIHPPTGPWGRALAWWARAAELAPPLPLGLAADLGLLLAGTPLPADLGNDAYATFLRTAAATPAIRTARHLRLSEVAITAILAHLAHTTPSPAAYRLPPGTRPADIATRLIPPDGTEARPVESPLHLLTGSTPSLLAHLTALTPADIRFVAELGAGSLRLTDLADLRALTELLSLPTLTHSLVDEVLAFLPVLAEAAPGAALQTYAVDGYGGLARSGSLDAVLPSEWALPAVLLSYRYLNGELLYYGRERPPERRTTLVLLLVQLSDAMAGDMEVLVKASALALARAGQARGATVQVAPFDTRLHPPRGLARPSDVAALVRHPARGGVDLARVLGQVRTQVQARGREYARIELVWLLHAQTGCEQVGAIGALARGLRGQVGSRALFVSAGAALARPALAEVLVGRWASVGSAALHEAEARAQAGRALRGLARPGEREALAVEPPPTPKRRVVTGDPPPPADPAQALLDAARWDAALAELAPRARHGDDAAKGLLATMLEGPTRPTGSASVSLASPGAPIIPPLPLRMRAAEVLGQVGDPACSTRNVAMRPSGATGAPLTRGRSGLAMTAASHCAK